MMGAIGSGGGRTGTGGGSTCGKTPTFTGLTGGVRAGISVTPGSIAVISAEIGCQSTHTTAINAPAPRTTQTVEQLLAEARPRRRPRPRVRDDSPAFPLLAEKALRLRTRELLEELERKDIRLFAFRQGAPATVTFAS